MKGTVQSSRLRQAVAAMTREDLVIDAEGIPTLIEWAGGPVALARLINAFYDRVEVDEILSPFFPGGVGQTHREHVAAWWVEVLGGPATYTERLGGYEAMLSHHRG
jgi:hemoglobin